MIDKAKKLQSIYNKLIINFQDYGNECLKDTITKEIPEFLLRYNFKYVPQETMISLDYPILKDLGIMTGVNAVLEYVECICLEQQFLSKFDSRYVIETHTRLHDEYDMMFMNIYHIILQNIMKQYNITDIISFIKEHYYENDHELAEYLNRTIVKFKRC